MQVEKRLTIDELAERPALPRTTIYHWVRDLPIPGSGGGFRTEAQRMGTRAMQAHYRRRREAAYDRAVRSYPTMIQAPDFRDSLTLSITRDSGEAVTRLRFLTPTQSPDDVRKFWSDVIGV